MRRILSQPVLTSNPVCNVCSNHMQKSKSDSSLISMLKSKSESNLVDIYEKKQDMNIKEQKSKPIKIKFFKKFVVFKKVFKQHGKHAANVIQDLEVANELVNSHENLGKTLALTGLLLYSMDNVDEQIKRFRLIIGTFAILQCIHKYLI